MVFKRQKINAKRGGAAAGKKLLKNISAGNERAGTRSIIREKYYPMLKKWGIIRVTPR